MTQEQIAGTRVIAEYMGEYSSFLTPKGEVMLTDEEGFTGHLESFGLNYHTSLDSIAPVVAKISIELISKHQDEGAKYVKQIYGNPFIIESIFPAVVAAIQFINEQNK